MHTFIMNFGAGQFYMGGVGDDFLSSCYRMYQRLRYPYHISGRHNLEHDPADRFQMHFIQPLNIQCKIAELLSCRKVLLGTNVRNAYLL